MALDVDFMYVRILHVYCFAIILLLPLKAIVCTLQGYDYCMYKIMSLTYVRYRSIITSFLHAWRRVAPREIFKYSRSVFAWTTISRGVEHTRLVYHHAWLLHARLLHVWPLHAWLLHTWLAITRVAGYYTRG